MTRVDCPGCNAQHNDPETAASCREAKARKLASVASREQAIAENFTAAAARWKERVGYHARQAPAQGIDAIAGKFRALRTA